MPAYLPSDTRRDPTDGFSPRRNVRLSEEVWEWLEEIAEREGLFHGHFPSRPKAIAWLVGQDKGRRKK